MTFLIIRSIREAYHLRMISYRATLTNRTGLRPKEGEVSAVHLHRDSVFLTGKFDPILHQTDSPVNDLWINLPVVNSWTVYRSIMFDRTGRTGTAVSGQADRSIIYRKDRTGQKSPTKSTEPDRPGPNWASISRRVHGSRDRIGPDRTELGVNLQTSPPVTGQSSYLPVKGR